MFTANDVTEFLEKIVSLGYSLVIGGRFGSSSTKINEFQ